MSQLIEYFNLDFKGAAVTSTVTVTLSGDNVDKSLEVKVKLNAWHDPSSSTRLCTFYIPPCEFTYSVCKGIIDDLPKLIKENSLVDTILFHQIDQNIGFHSTVYSHRIYFYCETPLELVELKELSKQCDEKGIFVTIRSQDLCKSYEQ